MAKTMTMKQFQKTLASYGADVTRWPDETAARTFLKITPQARDVLQQAALLDRTLNSFTAPAAQITIAPMRKTDRHKASFVERFWLPGSGLAFAGLAALMIMLQPPVPPEMADTSVFLEEMQRIATQTDEELRQADELMAFLEDAAPVPATGDDTEDQPIWDYIMQSS